MHSSLNFLLKFKFYVFFSQKEDLGVGDLANAAAALAQTPADVGGEVVILLVTRAVAAISQRLNNLANFDGVESKVCLWTGCHMCFPPAFAFLQFYSFYFSLCSL